MSRPLYFLHIPKTGGTSLRRVLQRSHPKRKHSPLTHMLALAEQVQAGATPLKRHKLFMGHMGYSLVQYLPEPPNIVTMLRDPVARTVSDFGHVQRHSDHWMYRVYGDETLTLEEWLENDGVRNLISNFQVRNIALNFDLSKPFFDRDGKPISPRQGPLFAYCTSDPSAVNTMDRALLDLAKKRIEQFACVGVTDRFEDSMRLLLARFGWSVKQSVPQLNQAPQGRAEPAISAEARELIEELTQLDRELFDFANALIDERLKSCPTPPLPRPSFWQRLRGG